MDTGKREIPFGRPARVGNFKIWRSRKMFGRGKNKIPVEQINVSTLDEEWQIKIPATFEIFAMIRDLFADNTEQRTAQLSTILGNMLYASCIPNGYYQRAINLCATIYANPNLLNDDDERHEDMMNNVRALVAGFLEWRKQYDKHVAENEPTEEEIKNDEVAEEMLEQVDKMESESSEKESDEDR